MASAQGLIDYIAAGPSPFHCVSETVRRLLLMGFSELDDAAPPVPVKPGDRGFVQRGGTLIAWHAGSEAPAEAGFRLVGAHTDSPNLRLKPISEYTKEGYVQWGVEPYGGVLLATWTDRDLGLSGRVAFRHGAGVKTQLVRIERPIARIPNVAIHLNRKVNDEGLRLNKQTHMPPMVGLAGGLEEPGLLRALLASEVGCEADDLLSWDLGLHDVHQPALGGLNEEFVFAPRLDNQASCYTALEALLAMSGPSRSTAIITLFDHEECGSGSERGAASTLLRNVLVRLERDHDVRSAGGIERAVANSFMVSADMAHGVHPNYADKHDKHHRPMLNGGPVIKSNVNMRYATDAETSAMFQAACSAAGAPVQQFVNRADLACGSTIGPISASGLAIRSVDVGCAMLSMHSIREQAGSEDVAWMASAKQQFLSNS